MANSDDACVPQTLTDFVFDLFDSVTLSQLTEEQSRLYNTEFRDLSNKYFTSSPWPSPQSIASECNGDPLFLAFYRELTHRHWHAVSRPSLRDRMEGWDVYRELFDELLIAAEEDASSTDQPKLFILPEWAFDILNEFVYQFQGFCQFRTALYISANKNNLFSGEPNPKTPHHVIENLALMRQEDAADVWSVETVLYYLHRLVAIGSKSSVPVYQHFGIFASVTMSRLECLLADYSSCLQCMAPILESTATVSKPDQETQTFPEVLGSVFNARLSLTYHAGVSFLMLRRYKDAASMVGSLCAYMQRGFKTGQLRKQPNSDQLFKNYDRMIALLAIVTQLCPHQNLVEESVARVIREKYSAQISKENYTELFVICAPKFVSPIIPDFHKPGHTENVHKLQVNMFENEVASQSAYRELRSFMKLYTSIGVSKLTSFGTDEKSLPSLKLKMRQMESDNAATPSLKAASLKSALDIHFYLENDEVVHINEAEKQRRFENYFMSKSIESLDIRKDACAVDTNV